MDLDCVSKDCKKSVRNVKNGIRRCVRRDGTIDLFHNLYLPRKRRQTTDGSRGGTAAAPLGYFSAAQPPNFCCRLPSLNCRLVGYGTGTINRAVAKIHVHIELSAG
jgi:hypothetical protein